MPAASTFIQEILRDHFGTTWRPKRRETQKRSEAKNASDLLIHGRGGRI